MELELPTLTRLKPAWILLSKMHPKLNYIEVENLVKEFWKHPLNIEARNIKIERDEYEKRMFAISSEITSSEIDLTNPEDEINFQMYLSMHFRHAACDPNAYDFLSDVILDWLKSGKSIPDEIIEATIWVLENPRPKTNKRKKKLETINLDCQLAYAVMAVYEGTGQVYGLGTSSGTEAKNAFVVVETATGYPFDKIRDAYRNQHFKRLPPRREIDKLD